MADKKGGKDSKKGDKKGDKKGGKDGEDGEEEEEQPSCWDKTTVFIVECCKVSTNNLSTNAYFELVYV